MNKNGSVISRLIHCVDLTHFRFTAHDRTGCNSKTCGATRSRLIGQIGQPTGEKVRERLTNERSLLTACHDFNMQFEQNRSWHVKPLKSVALRLKSRRGNWHYLDMRSLKRTTLKSNKWQVSNCLNEIQLYIINKQLVRGSKKAYLRKASVRVAWKWRGASINDYPVLLHYRN